MLITAVIEPDDDVGFQAYLAVSSPGGDGVYQTANSRGER